MQLTDTEIQALETAAKAAGAAILTHFKQNAAVQRKKDRSFVTAADKDAHDVVLAQLRHLFPDVPVVSEEDENWGDISRAEYWWVVDPLDGTRSFVEGEPEFTVNMGLVHKHQPVFGLIYAPVPQLLYAGGRDVAPYRKAQDVRTLIHCRKPAVPLIITRSRSTPSKRAREWLEAQAPHEMRPSSGALKFCWVAEGSADIYPRFGRTMEWDTAAGQAIIEAAGGSVTTPEGEALSYGKPGFENEAFIARGL